MKLLFGLVIAVTFVPPPIAQFISGGSSPPPTMEHEAALLALGAVFGAIATISADGVRNLFAAKVIGVHAWVHNNAS
jgi:hypothetical protein